MSATPATACEHEWEDTMLRYHIYEHGADVLMWVGYCPSCMQFAAGPEHIVFQPRYKRKQLLPANTKEAERLTNELRAWLAAHYPEHVREEA